MSSETPWRKPGELYRDQLHDDLYGTERAGGPTDIDGRPLAVGPRGGAWLSQPVPCAARCFNGHHTMIAARPGYCHVCWVPVSPPPMTQLQRREP